MELFINGRLIAEVVQTKYTITKKEKADIIACSKKLSVQILLTSNNDLLVVFENLQDMLAFDEHSTHKLGEELFSQIKIQHMTKDITYSYKFKPADFEKYIRRMNDHGGRTPRYQEERFYSS
ncbi:MAG: hypothetical protein US83_C0019G0017 [Candidatus Falkowbacteria bacterium GW2011_GWC2_38_22]|uniref:Uncharacterized protein n=1 Tax=Candidatus Falkowbacteria bacterium GW2011_GWE1_38_31 TaxID=1618638 RepID=A0A0G0M6S7_9BACT|nr:MAG: hypothetical protein US73_C0017G0003 [Candidatus Falkowbacteria bacterium GW2011_GWF2_38_1205]KKQ60423.1 MAG: hypothetical protein US83_C0019G0017 [Candidatus Falkowbacteria bacterium GW2011_GWC2_38_22]KKQ62470.1 MAG: hypothetical protein US84_C0016G0017 [Candidatus Falkowbacteria bacterium GW2011_GWF1_38_22]KKQ64541.1 MAG: hypothetical protein US87_C0016G0017 [Candidatus Falkowbacteria bacterium GW2011_GWE2_38_254]KKQ69379.1 MAG: hypothetical protein US91_C0015G0017 [Candidatus Falkowb